MTEELTADPPSVAAEEPKRQSDFAIGSQLVRGGYLTSAQFEVWERARRGESIYSMERDYPNRARGDVPYSCRTLYMWVQKVDAAIAAARLVEAPVVVLPSPFGISIADSHEVRRAADGTPLGRVPTESSTWDYERLALVGKLDRYSRKRK